MLIQNTQSPKLSYITITWLIMGFSLLAAIPAPADTELIGPEGGEVYAGHNSNLIVPAVALTNDKLIAAESFEEVITSDDETIVSGLKKALLILDAQYTYIYKLPIEETICDEWVKPEEIKKSIYTKIEAIQDNVTKALQVHQEDNNSDALMEIRGVLGQLDDLAVEIKNLCAKGNIGRVAYDTI